MSKQRLAVIAVLVGAAFTPPGQSALDEFIAGLRIHPPEAVTATVGSSATTSSRPLQDAVASMLSPAPTVVLEEPDSVLPGSAQASTYAGFTPLLVRARHDSSRLSGVGARTVQSTIDRRGLRTILDQAGRNDVATPAALDRARFAFRIPRAIRATYGNCPAPAAPTIQGQLQGAPPPTPDNGSCLRLFETRAATADLPQALRVDQLVAIAMELAGMSPNQSDAFRRVADWQSVIALSLPRGMRSYDTLSVRGAPAMLINTGGRRGPTYALIWQRDGIVFSLSGYGNPAEAPALAESVR